MGGVHSPQDVLPCPVQVSLLLRPDWSTEGGMVQQPDHLRFVIFQILHGSSKCSLFCLGVGLRRMSCSGCGQWYTIFSYGGPWGDFSTVQVKNLNSGILDPHGMGIPGKFSALFPRVFLNYLQSLQLDSCRGSTSTRSSPSVWIRSPRPGQRPSRVCSLQDPPQEDHPWPSHGPCVGCPWKVHPGQARCSW